VPADDESRVETGRILLAVKVRQQRLRARLGLPELAERTGLSMAFLSDVERARKLPSLPALDALATGLGTTASTLLRGVYPWGSTKPPEEPPAAPTDGRAGRKIPSRGPSPRRGQPRKPE
jgi:transcriptional regulator with XRE-family HTH domain